VTGQQNARPIAERASATGAANYAAGVSGAGKVSVSVLVAGLIAGVTISVCVTFSSSSMIFCGELIMDKL
jgi:hypothetical protein